MSGYLISNQAVFFVTAGFVLPALVALSQIRASEIDPETARGGINNETAEPRPHRRAMSLARLLRRRPLVIFAACVMLFQLANAAMLPLMGSVMTVRSGQWATVLIAACIVVPQLVVAACVALGRPQRSTPWASAAAAAGFRHGADPRPVVCVGDDPYLLVAVQLLDGVAAAVFGVMVPLVIADVARGTGRFNLSQGIVGTATGLGAAISTSLAGYVSDHFGSPIAFLGLAGIAAAGLVLVWALMPETGPPRPKSDTQF